MDQSVAFDNAIDADEPAPSRAVPELLLPMCLLITVLVALEFMIGSPFIRTELDSVRAAQIAGLGFAPWAYLLYGAAATFKAAETLFANTPSRQSVRLELFCIAVTIAGETLLTALLVAGTRVTPGIAMQGVPPWLVMIAFAAPFVLGVPACFSYALRLSRLIGATRSGIRPAVLLSVGLLQPFTLLGASATALLLIGGPQTVIEWGPVPLCIICAAVGCLLSTLGLETLRLSVLKRLSDTAGGAH